MKAKSILLATLLMITFLLNSVAAQNVQVDGKDLSVSYKAELTKGVAFYKLKGKSGASQNYIKANNKFSKTVFNESELKNFLKKGTLSSLGTVNEQRFTKTRKIKYVKKGNTYVFLFAKKGAIGFSEFTGDISVLAKANNDGGQSGEDKAEECRRTNCDAATFDCDDDITIYDDEGDIVLDGKDCADEWIACLINCRKLTTIKFRQYIVPIDDIKIRL